MHDILAADTNALLVTPLVGCLRFFLFFSICKPLAVFCLKFRNLRHLFETPETTAASISVSGVSNKCSFSCLLHENPNHYVRYIIQKKCDSSYFSLLTNLPFNFKKINHPFCEWYMVKISTREIQRVKRLENTMQTIQFQTKRTKRTHYLVQERKNVN